MIELPVLIILLSYWLQSCKTPSNEVKYVKECFWTSDDVNPQIIEQNYYVTNFRYTCTHVATKSSIYIYNAKRRHFMTKEFLPLKAMHVSSQCEKIYPWNNNMFYRLNILITLVNFHFHYKIPTSTDTMITFHGETNAKYYQKNANMELRYFAFGFTFVWTGIWCAFISLMNIWINEAYAEPLLLAKLNRSNHVCGHEQ